MLVVCPKWTKIPCMVIVARNCHNLFLKEKRELKQAFRGQGVCLTTYTWASIPNLNYMCLTTHLLIMNGVCTKKILNFCLVENHKGQTLENWLNNACLSMALRSS